LGLLANLHGRTAGATVAATRETLITSDQVSLNLLRSNDVDAHPQRPRVLFLPGWCMPGSIWRNQWPALTGRWPWLAMDPRGQGLSAIPSRGYTIQRRVEDLHETITRWGPVVIVAWSLGVLEALEYVGQHGTQALRGLMLVDNSIGEPPPPRGGGHFRDDLQQHRATALETFIRGMFTRPVDPELLDEIRASALRMPLKASLDLLAYPFPREHWRDLVHGADCPLAYVVTARFAEQAQHLRAARPDARIEIFAAAGHALFVDESDRFNHLLTDWLEEGTSPSADR
jgi:microsomal epoxide hydrolase